MTGKLPPRCPWCDRDCRGCPDCAGYAVAELRPWAWALVLAAVAVMLLVLWAG